VALSKRIDDERLNNDKCASRLSADRSVTENRNNTDSVRSSERHAMLRDVNTLLPVPPEIPGYHLCWLTTTNNKDTLENRYRLGYSLVKPEELPGFKLSSQKDGEASSDRIMVNEMVLAKIPYDLWKEDMTYLHHTLPNESIENLKNSVRLGQDGKGRSVAYTGGEFNQGASDGYSHLKGSKTPTFAGIS
jgi:hypothetical protein